MHIYLMVCVEIASSNLCLSFHSLYIAFAPSEARSSYVRGFIHFLLYAFLGGGWREEG